MSSRKRSSASKEANKGSDAQTKKMKIADLKAEKQRAQADIQQQPSNVWETQQIGNQDLALPKVPSAPPEQRQSPRGSSSGSSSSMGDRFVLDTSGGAGSIQKIKKQTTMNHAVLASQNSIRSVQSTGGAKKKETRRKNLLKQQTSKFAKNKASYNSRSNTTSSRTTSQMATSQMESFNSEDSWFSRIQSTEELYIEKKLKGEQRSVNLKNSHSRKSSRINKLELEKNLVALKHDQSIESSERGDIVIDLLRDFNMKQKQAKDRKENMKLVSSCTQLQQELIHAIKSLNYALFIDLGGIDRVDLNFKYANQEMVGVPPETPLFCAVAKGDITMLRLVLMNPVLDINFKDEATGVNAFWLACYFGFGMIMHALAEAGIDVLVVNDKKVNALHLAVIQDYYHVVSMLIRSGYPMTLETADGMNALHIAAYHGRADLLELMTSYLADNFPNRLQKFINLINRETQMSALSYALMNSHTSCAAVLISHHAQLFYDGNDLQKDYSPIFLCLQIQDIHLLEMMCGSDFPKKARTSLGQTPLMFAAEQNYKNVVNMLSMRAYNLNEEDKQGMTVLLHQVLQNNFKMATRLIERGADIDFVNSFGKTALHICVEYKLLEQVKYLLFKGANPHILDLNEMDCCDKAKGNGLVMQINRLLNCNQRMKIIPRLPDGSYPQFEHEAMYTKQEVGTRLSKFDPVMPMMLNKRDLNDIEDSSSSENSITDDNKTAGVDQSTQPKEKIHKSPQKKRMSQIQKDMIALAAFVPKTKEGTMKLDRRMVTTRYESQPLPEATSSEDQASQVMQSKFMRDNFIKAQATGSKSEFSSTNENLLSVSYTLLNKGRIPKKKLVAGQAKKKKSSNNALKSSKTQEQILLGFHPLQEKKGMGTTKFSAKHTFLQDSSVISEKIEESESSKDTAKDDLHLAKNEARSKIAWAEQQISLDKKKPTVHFDLNSSSGNPSVSQSRRKETPGSSSYLANSPQKNKRISISDVTQSADQSKLSHTASPSSNFFRSVTLTNKFPSPGSKREGEDSASHPIGKIPYHSSNTQRLAESNSKPESNQAQTPWAALPEEKTAKTVMTSPKREQAPSSSIQSARDKSKKSSSQIRGGTSSSSKARPLTHLEEKLTNDKTYLLDKMKEILDIQMDQYQHMVESAKVQIEEDILKLLSNLDLQDPQWRAKHKIGGRAGVKNPTPPGIAKSPISPNPRRLFDKMNSSDYQGSMSSAAQVRIQSPAIIPQQSMKTASSKRSKFQHQQHGTGTKEYSLGSSENLSIGHSLQRDLTRNVFDDPGQDSGSKGPLRQVSRFSKQSSFARQFSAAQTNQQMSSSLFNSSSALNSRTAITPAHQNSSDPDRIEEAVDEDIDDLQDGIPNDDEDRGAPKEQLIEGDEEHDMQAQIIEKSGDLRKKKQQLVRFSYKDPAERATIEKNLLEAMEQIMAKDEEEEISRQRQASDQLTVDRFDTPKFYLNDSNAKEDLKTKKIMKMLKPKILKELCSEIANAYFECESEVPIGESAMNLEDEPEIVIEKDEEDTQNSTDRRHLENPGPQIPPGGRVFRDRFALEETKDELLLQSPKVEDSDQFWDGARQTTKAGGDLTKISSGGSSFFLIEDSTMMDNLRQRNQSRQAVPVSTMQKNKENNTNQTLLTMQDSEQYLGINRQVPASPLETQGHAHFEDRPSNFKQSASAQSTTSHRSLSSQAGHAIEEAKSPEQARKKNPRLNLASRLIIQPSVTLGGDATPKSYHSFVSNNYSNKTGSNHSPHGTLLKRCTTNIESLMQNLQVAHPEMDLQSDGDIQRKQSNDSSPKIKKRMVKFKSFHFDGGNQAAELMEPIVEQQYDAMKSEDIINMDQFILDMFNNNDEGQDKSLTDDVEEGEEAKEEQQHLESKQSIVDRTNSAASGAAGDPSTRVLRQGTYTQLARVDFLQNQHTLQVSPAQASSRPGGDLLASEDLLNQTRGDPPTTSVSVSIDRRPLHLRQSPQRSQLANPTVEDDPFVLNLEAPMEQEQILRTDQDQAGHLSTRGDAVEEEEKEEERPPPAHPSGPVVFMPGC